MITSKTRKLTLLLFVCLPVQVYQAQLWRPEAATIDKLEASIKPSDYPKWGYLHPPVLTDYARYYTATRRHGHRILSGEFILDGIEQDRSPGVYIVKSEKDFPVIMDGGCAIVHVLYDVDSAHLLSLTCNGQA